jgi:methyl-accepting chemotaxis protein
MNELQASIAAAAEQQTAATNEISRTVTDASVRSGAIAIGIGQVAAHSAQTAGAASSTQRTAGDLARTAAELREIVGSFRS